MPGRNSIRCTEKSSVLRRSPRLRISNRLPESEKTITTVISPSFSSSSAPVKPISERKPPRYSSHSGLPESVKTIEVRRSQRFMHRCDFSSPESDRWKSAKIHLRSSDASMSAEDCPRYSLKECREKTKGKLSDSNRGYGKSEDLSTGLRKSPRLNNGDEGFESPRRSSRLSNLRNDDACGYRLREVSKEAMLFNGVPRNSLNKHCRSRNNLRSESCEGQSQSLRKSQRFRRQGNTVDASRGAISDNYDDAKRSPDVLNAQVNESTIHNSCAKSGRRADDINCKVAPVRRKRERDDKGIELNQGWTIEQEAALQRAYYVAKPTPHFWKRVSKLVPGKSAQECFDKVHSNHLTPPQPRPRLRAKKMKISPLTISENELLRLDPKDKVLCCSKRKNLRFVQKTVRHLLQKNCRVDQDCEIDLFSILEPDLDTEELQPNVMLSTPDNLKKKTLPPQKCHSRSSIGKKPLSRFSISCSSDSILVSPPVLKQVKNRVLHEKYIDQLHCREAKRKAVTARLKKSTIEDAMKEEQVLKVDVVRAAKHALVSDARDAIDHFKHLRANERSFSEDLDEKEDYYSHNEDDEDYAPTLTSLPP